MKSIERRFNDLQQKRPGCSSLVNFNSAVKGQKFSRDRIGRWFVRLVDKEERDEYTASTERQLVRYAFSLSSSEAYAKQG